MWSKIDETNKAILILHEVWYRETIKNGSNDSRHARYLNGAVSSDKWSTIKTDADYMALLDLSKKFGFQMSYTLPIDSNGLSCKLVENGSRFCENVPLTNVITRDGNAKLVSGTIYFGDDGSLKFFSGAGRSKLNFKNGYIETNIVDSVPWWSPTYGYDISPTLNLSKHGEIELVYGKGIKKVVVDNTNYGKMSYVKISKDGRIIEFNNN